MRVVFAYVVGWFGLAYLVGLPPVYVIMLHFAPGMPSFIDIVLFVWCGTEC